AWLAVFVFGGLAIVGVLAEMRLGTFRPWAADYRFAGTVHPNTQAAGLATFCIAAFCLVRGSTGRNLWIWTAFAIGLLLLVLTKSRTTTAGIFLAIAVGPLLETRLRTKLGAALAMVWLACIAIWALSICGFNLPDDFRDALLLGRAEESDTL